MNGIERIAAERKRQIEVEGRSASSDQLYEDDQLASAAACYALPTADARGNGERDEGREDTPFFWPWSVQWWKPTPGNRIRELEKAGALIAAEIDRLLASVKDGDA